MRAILTPQQVALVVNALREKASEDRDTVRLAVDRRGPIAQALLTQAAQAEELANTLEGAQEVRVS